MSGSSCCACRDCCEIAISDDENEPDLCLECEQAGCSVEGDAECLAEHAYPEECSDEPWPCSMCEGGEVVPMGKLARTEHGRCRACGMDQNRDGGL